MARSTSRTWDTYQGRVQTRIVCAKRARKLRRLGEYVRYFGSNVVTGTKCFTWLMERP